MMGKRHSLRDEVIAYEPPLTLEKIAQEVTRNSNRLITSKGIARYMKATQQFDSWKQRRYNCRKRLKDEKEATWRAKQQFVNLLFFYIIKKAEEEGLATEKAVQYYLKKRKYNYLNKNSINLKRLIGLFTDYYQARDEGRLLSLEELGKPHDIFFTHVGVILAAVGEEPLYGTRERHPTQQWKKEALQRSIDLPLTYTDIGYLLELPRYVVDQLRGHYGRAGKTIDRWVTWLGNFKDRELIFYRNASQLYEALDVGFSNEEARIYTGISKQGYDYLVKHRETIEATLVDAIRVLYKKPTHDKPYVTMKLKEETANKSEKRRSPCG